MAFLVNNLLHSAFFQLIVDQAQQCFIHYFEQFIVNLKTIYENDHIVLYRFIIQSYHQGLISFLGHCLAKYITLQNRSCFLYLQFCKKFEPSRIQKMLPAKCNEFNLRRRLQDEVTTYIPAWIAQYRKTLKQAFYLHFLPLLNCALTNFYYII